ncbi:biotin--[acetyl-CoA-carboxylase] ligase [Synechococcus elongatus]|uniref:biotin--[acetyl-CoA-carboxylase] ligase n=1 Tax=Synechococcus elongatus TaxID=32046 RepID=UPI000F7F7ED4|nr:biotin--[acetyl-CoA-carboxylase] ligase [Synechococcus elongatus]
MVCLNLQQQAQQAGIRYRLRTIAVTDSTNAQLWQQADRHEQVLIAAQQRAGRGQQGRSWLSPLGGLYLSLGLDLDLHLSESARLIFGAAWGVAQSLRSQVPVQLKWPNDLVLDNRKLGGILVETRSQGDRLREAVIGLGLNGSNPVPETGIALQSVSTAWADLPDLAIAVLQGLQTGLDQWLADDWGTLIPLYDQWLYRRGDRLTWQGQIVTLLGIDPSGGLRLQGRDRPWVIVQPGDLSLWPWQHDPKTDPVTHQ